MADDGAAYRFRRLDIRLTGGFFDMLAKCLSRVVVAAAAVAMLASVAHAERGGDGHLKILYWQAVSTLNP